jgi:ribosomal protein S18 acetylase RimI-like enzyme
MDVTIRRILLKDAQALAQIGRQTFYDTFTGTCTEEDMQRFLEEYFNLAQVQNELKNENDFYFFAELNGEPVGYVRFMEDYSNFPVVKQWKALELKRLYVLKEYHGKGIAQQLMDFFLSFAEEKKYQLVWLGVWEHNIRAQKFYEKYGFVNSGHIHDFPIGNTPQTDFWFWKFLQ